MGRRREQRQKARARKLAALQERATPGEAGTPIEEPAAAPMAAIEPAGGEPFGDSPESIETVNDVWLLRRAIECEWQIPASQRALIRASLQEIALKSPFPLMRIAAAKALIAADSVNVRREATAAKLIAGNKAAGGVTVNVAVGIQQEVASKSDDDLRRIAYEIRRRRELIEAAERTCA